jgi:hypothetical protein
VPSIVNNDVQGFAVKASSYSSIRQPSTDTVLQVFPLILNFNLELYAALTSSYCSFKPSNRFDMFGRGRESGFHRVHRQVGRAQILPSLHYFFPLFRRSLGETDPSFNANPVRLSAGFPRVGAKLFN